MSANIVSPSSLPRITSDGDNITSVRRIVSDKVTQPLLCPITHALMVDPVLAEDGHTYERYSIEKWLSKNSTSPLIPNKQLEISKLVAERRLQETIEALVETGAIDDDLSDCWKEKKKELDLVKAKKIFDKGCILDAAKLGLPKAQGMVSCWYMSGMNGLEKDCHQGLEWARKAAEGGDTLGQFITGYLYHATSEISEAIVWHKKAAKQGFAASMHFLGCIYKNDRYKPHYNLQKATFWYRRGVNMSHIGCLVEMGQLYYKGEGVKMSHKNARELFEKAVIKIGLESSDEWLRANFLMGRMMVRGEGGSKDIIGGITLIQKAASDGLSDAEEYAEGIAKIL